MITTEMMARARRDAAAKLAKAQTDFLAAAAPALSPDQHRYIVQRLCVDPQAFGARLDEYGSAQLDGYLKHVTRERREPPDGASPRKRGASTLEIEEGK
ncbi:MAG: hypothetical protein M1482_10390 [Chloroflexi bacterium]|nr:hypothetical protein [Chloroflexota bacterium]